jgi:ATP-dependent DNA helicase RecG
LSKNLKEGSSYLLSGRLNPKTTRPQLLSPAYEPVDPEELEAIHLGRIVPVYKLSEGISQKWLRRKIFGLINDLDMITDLRDHMPEQLRKRFRINGLVTALKNIHFPENREQIFTARRRLAFDELLQIHYRLYQTRQSRLKTNAPEIKLNLGTLRSVRESLDFKLTSSQESTLKEILQDLGRIRPMKRLLQGDVGSGKTIVAVLASLPVVESGYQVLVMAPTSILAEQLYSNFRRTLPAEITIELLTAATKKKLKHKPDILIGTHALLFNRHLITNPGLIIIDEQHRFGVKQRSALSKLQENSLMPHMLSMTATPIPRTLALSLFGDYDLSSIDKPAGRISPETFLVPEQKRQSSYNWINAKVIQGGQVFWVVPVIEENPDSELKSVKSVQKQLTVQFPEFKIGLLHGKLKEEEKAKVLNKFRQKTLDLLISTTVVEVGIDIPEANIIVIESAERFGLAQLHQLRGRVGRRGQESWCLLFTSLENDHNVVNRLKFFAENKVGVEIAEFDLKQRGPGEVYGTIQSGIPPLKIANFSNLGLLKETQEAAKLLLEDKNNDYFASVDPWDNSGLD